MNHVLVITTEPLPVPGGLTTGAGLRAWGLAEGLTSRGFQVTIATPLEGDQAHAQAENPTDDRVRYFQRTEMQRLLDDVKPDVVVMQHWGLIYALPPLNCPLAIDLAGPHLLERLYWGNPDPQRDLDEKLTALRRADFITCGGTYQRHYFYPYLRMSGFDVRSDAFPVIPFSVPPQSLDVGANLDGEPTFIYGGAFLAWQNPERALRLLLEEMDRAGRGRLLFYGGSHPSIDASGGKFIELYQYLKSHPRVEMRGWKPFWELVHEYAAEGHVALDLMERNPERELAYTTRTMVYLYCGLPVIYSNYSELTGLIESSESGWCLDPEDDAGFRELVASILENPAIATAKRPQAREVAHRQNWEATIAPLAEFCANPIRRIHKNPSPAGTQTASALDTHEATSQEQPHFAPQTKSSAFESFFHNKGKLMGNLVYIPIWLMSRYLEYRLRIKR